MPPRLHIDQPLQAGAELALPASASRHVQVLRLQPGAALTLFDGRGGQWSAQVLAIGRKVVTARVEQHDALERELATAVTLALVMPANERMDMVIEKATELGAAALQPLMSSRSVLRLAGERAQRKTQHWQAIASSACEQSGRNRVPAVAEPQALASWLGRALPPGSQGLLLSLADEAQPLVQRLRERGEGALVLLSGPEGGLTPQEQDAAWARGFVPVSLGPRVLRADTAPLAALAAIAALAALPPD